jgi:hypothetical protein
MFHHDETTSERKRNWSKRGESVRQAYSRLLESLRLPPETDTVRGFLVTLKPRVAALARAWNLACRVPTTSGPITPRLRADDEFRGRILTLWSLTQDLEEVSRRRTLEDPSHFLAQVEWLRGDLLTWIRSFEQSGRLEERSPRGQNHG